MTSGTNFWDASVWSFVGTLAILFVAMLFAGILRNQLSFIRKLMIPSSVLGGFLILLIAFLYKEISGNSMFQSSVLEMLTYHGLGLGFAAMSLRELDREQKESGGRMKGSAFDASLNVVGSYLIQGIFGLTVTMLLAQALGSFFASGLILPMGYGQGPGQAYNWGHTYEVSYGFTDGTSFGLTVAAMGFIASSVGGIIYLNSLRRKGVIQGEAAEITEEDLSAQTITGKGEIGLSESMDKFTVQLALVFATYGLAYLFMRGVDAVIETGALGNLGYNTLRPLIWGFNFLFSTVFALLVKNIFSFALDPDPLSFHEFKNGEERCDKLRFVTACEKKLTIRRRTVSSQDSQNMNYLRSDGDDPSRNYPFESVRRRRKTFLSFSDSSHVGFAKHDRVMDSSVGHIIIDLRRFSAKIIKRHQFRHYRCDTLAFPVLQQLTREFLFQFLGFLFVLRKKHCRFDIYKPRSHFKEFGRYVHLFFLHAFYLFGVLFKEHGYFDIIDIKFIFRDKIQKQIKRSFKNRKLVSNLFHGISPFDNIQPSQKR